MKLYLFVDTWLERAVFFLVGLRYAEYVTFSWWWFVVPFVFGTAMLAIAKSEVKK